MELFVRTLQSGVLPVCFATPPSLFELRDAIAVRSGVPAALQRLRCGVRDLRADDDVAALPSGATVCLLLRLVGGKGGFGSLLRVQGRDTKATTNFDACRDLSGRRLRHANAEKKMEEWRKKTEDRELQQVALEHIKEMAREQKRSKRKAIDPAVVSALQKQTVSSVRKAVQSALKNATDKSSPKRKRPRFDDVDSSDEESSDVTGRGLVEGPVKEN